jgi:hypothetical protein
MSRIEKGPHNIFTSGAAINVSDPAKVLGGFSQKINSTITNSPLSEGLWAQLQQGGFMPIDPTQHPAKLSDIMSITITEKEYLETIALAADLLAGEVISAQEFFKLKLLLKSPDEDVKKAGIIFLNQKAKL